jgi:hypothetical protein
MIITSHWRGLDRGAKPKRSTSKRGIATCIISIAQQATPNRIHMSDLVRAHAISSSAAATRNRWNSRARAHVRPAGMITEIERMLLSRSRRAH